MAFLEIMKETLETGDPTIRSWPLVQSYWAPFLLCGAYIFFIKRLGPALMHNRKPFDLRLLMILYNFGLVLIYIWSLLTLLYYIFTTDAYTMICADCVVLPNHFTYTCTSVGWYLYMLKYVEFADTVFFVLRKKDHLVTNLHLIHHTALPIISWILLRTETSGFQFIPAGINSFVHIIMYTYYGLVAMKMKLWWKEYLTLLQMGQFVVILLLVFVVIPLIGCKTTLHGIYFDIFFASLFLALFYNYYTKTYNRTLSISNKMLHKNGFSQNGFVQNGHSKKES